MDLWSEKLLAEGKPSLKYACYLVASGETNYYAYAKAPLGSSLVMYWHTDGKSIATSSSQLVEAPSEYGNVWISVSEDKAVYILLNTVEAPRHTAGDIYE